MGRSSGGGGRSGGGATATAGGGISESTFLGAEPESRLETIAGNAEVTLQSALSSVAQAEAMSNLVSTQNIRIFDNDGAIDRMDWNSSYANPTRNMMIDSSGGGFLATLNFANNLRVDINNGGGTAIGSHSLATARQAYEVGKFKLNRMWQGASNADRAAALKASSATPRQLRQLGLDLRLN